MERRRARRTGGMTAMAREDRDGAGDSDPATLAGFPALGALVTRMKAQLAQLRERRDPRRFFHATYLRTTQAVGAELTAGGFLDAAWVERWDVAFAGFYLDALQAGYHARLAELEQLATARVADLARPGQVLLRLAARGFGIELSPDAWPAPPPRHLDHQGGS